VFKKRIKKEKKNMGKKFSKRDYFLVFLLIISLSAFFHFREKRFMVFEVNSIAPKDIIAIQDFSYLDKKQMILLRQEALVDLGKIWSIQERDLKGIEEKFLRLLSNHPSWRKAYPVTYNEMKSLSQQVVAQLGKWHFADRRTIQKRIELGLSIKNYSRLENVVSKKSITLPNEFWQKLEGKIVSKNKAFAKEVQYIMGIYRGNRFLLERDHDERSSMEKSLYETVPEVYASRTKKDLIVRKGDMIALEEYDQILALKQSLKRARNLDSPRKMFSSLLFALLIVSIGWLYCSVRNKVVLKNTNKLSLYIVLIILSCAIAKLSEFTINSVPYSIAIYFQYPIIIPFMSILLALFINEEIALFTSLFLSVIVGFTLSLDHNYFIVINMFSGIVAALSASKMKKRKEIFFVCFKVWIVCDVTFMIYRLSVDKLITEGTVVKLIAFGANMIVIAVLLLVIIPIIEALFRIMTNMALMEFIDPTHPLLQRLSLEAPGTYQHSLSIGHIAEYAANAIGANGMLCRVTTLYHDIGKLNNPHYYTENQLITGQKPFNIHQLLTPIESAYIIKSHILDGKALAKQYNLPKIFIDIILEHHGTTLIKYFYVKQLEKMDNIKEDVDEKAFRYPGPKPQTKESAIIMLSDSIEAASRTLDENTEDAVRKLIENITSSKILDNQFDECDLTFDELATVKQKLVEIIKATHHLRIKYPESK
jgi:putative nucleotidyltransferase with HDIG domain